MLDKIRQSRPKFDQIFHIRPNQTKLTKTLTKLTKTSKLHQRLDNEENQENSIKIQQSQRYINSQKLPKSDTKYTTDSKNTSCKVSNFFNWIEIPQSNN